MLVVGGTTITYLGYGFKAYIKCKYGNIGTFCDWSYMTSSSQFWDIVTRYVPLLYPKL